MTSQQVDTKRTRKDRSAKLQARKLESETVVKCTLKGVLLLNGEIRSKFLTAIRNRVSACSIRVCNASVAINLLLQRTFDGKKDVASVQVPRFWDDTFIRQMMLGTTGADKPYSDVTKLHSLFPELLHNPGNERFLLDRNIYSFAAKKLSTNIKNHLNVNVSKMIGRMVYGLFSDRDQAVAAKYAIHGWKPPVYKRQKGSKETPTPFPSLLPATADVVKLARNALGLVNDGDSLNKSWFKSTNFPIHSIRFLVFANRQLENIPIPSDAVPSDNKAPRLCTLVPICGVRNHFVTLDTSCMYGVAKDSGVISTECSLSAFEELWEDHWRSIIDVDRVKGKICKFSGTIDTDGIATCIHFTRPKKQASDTTTDDIKIYDSSFRVLGVDPGRSNILYIAEKLSTGSYCDYVLSRSQYYAESGIKKANQMSRQWNQGIENCIKELSTVSAKGASLEKFMQYLSVWKSARETLYAEYSKDRWAQQRMRLYGGKKRVFANFLNRVEKGKKVNGTFDTRPIVLAYGSAKFAPTGNGELSVPTSRAFKECHYRFKCKLVDEFRTSRTYHKDGTLLQQVGVCSDPKVSGTETEECGQRTVRGLLWCGSTSDNGKFVNRDKNAAINILNCAISPSRPLWLTRISGQSPLPKQKIVKLITC